MATVEERVAALEKSVNAMRDQVRTRNLVLIDEKDASFAELLMTKDGPMLGMRDMNQKPRVILGMVENMPTFFLVDDNGRNRVQLLVRTEGPEANLYDENGMIRVGMKAYRDGAEVSLRDGSGRIRATLAEVNGLPGLCVMDENGKIRATLMADKQATTLDIRDDNQKSRLGLGFTKDGPYLEIRDPDDNCRASLRFFEDEGCAICLDDKGGHPALMLGENFLAFNDKDKKCRIRLKLEDHGLSLELRGTDGKTRAVLAVVEDIPGLILYDEHGKKVASL